MRDQKNTIALLVLLTGSTWAGLPHGNIHRTGYAPDTVRTPMKTAWVHTAACPPRPAWPEPVWEPQRIDFDYAYAVAAAGDRVFYASSSDHALHALDLETGREQWRFFTGGPVRLAPDFHGGHVLFGSDDGWVYCLKQMDGSLVWKYRPENIPDEWMIGNEQMISRWPCRSGVLVEGDLVYASFGMLAPEGVAVCCLDAKTGKLVWINDTCGHRYMSSPHSSIMGGVSPQGYMAVDQDRLVVACGRCTPAIFNKQTGELLHLDSEGDFTGGALTMIARDLVFMQADTLIKEYGNIKNQAEPEDRFAEHEIFDLATLVAKDKTTGREVFSLRGGAKGTFAEDGRITLIGKNQLISVMFDDVMKTLNAGVKELAAHTSGHFIENEPIRQWAAPVDRVYTLLQAGDTLLAGGRGNVEAFRATDGARLWSEKVDGQARALCLANGRLIASTTEGKIYCFANGHSAPARAEGVVERRVLPPPEKGGYALAVGRFDAAALEILAAQFDLTVYATADDPHALRRALAEKGLYGVRIAVQPIQGKTLPFTDYFADAVICNDVSAVNPLHLYRLLRPHGGQAQFACKKEESDSIRRMLEEQGVPEKEITNTSDGFTLMRGALPGEGVWTHQYGNPGKSASSKEQNVRLPLKAAWIGGLGPGTIVSRHQRTPAPLVINGRCFITGMHHVTAMNIYNGRLLWQRHIPDVAHWPAAYRGPGIAADEEAVYLATGLTCLVLDPATGKTLKTFAAPKDPGEATPKDSTWEYLAADGELILGAVGQPNVEPGWWSRAHPVNFVLFALDKATGQLRWRHTPEHGIDSNSIAMDEGVVCLIDGRPHYPFLFKNASEMKPRILRALDSKTGRELWKTDQVAPTENCVWMDDGVVVTTVIPFSRSMQDPLAVQAGGGITAWSARTGEKLWQVKKVKSMIPMIVDGVFYSPIAYDLKTGKKIPSATDSDRNLDLQHGMLCSTYAGCSALAMARFSSAGFMDLTGQSGAYYYPVIRSSCWINMIPAGGLVVIPEGGSSCQCAFNYKTSLALMADDRQFHFGVGASGLAGPPAVRINFGAPGDRPDAQGQVWFAEPRPGTSGRSLGKQPYQWRSPRGPYKVEWPASGTIRTSGRNPDWVDLAGADMPWMYSFAVVGPAACKIAIPQELQAARKLSVTLFFCELDPAVQSRVFDIRFNGEAIEKNFDCVKAAGGAFITLKKTYTVSAGPFLAVELAPAAGDAPPILNGLLIQGLE